MFSVAFTLLAIFLALKIKPVPQEVKVNPEGEKVEAEEVHVMAEM